MSEPGGLSLPLTITLGLNTLWFLGGFHLFWLRGERFARTLVRRDDRDTPAFGMLVQSGKFVAGFNLAFLVLNVLLLTGVGGFDTGRQWAVLLAANAVAHGSQFAGNVGTALENLRGGGVWRVLEGLMLFIFVVDFSLMLLNGGLAVASAW